MPSSPECRICQENSRFYVRKNNSDVYKCSACGVLFVWPLEDVGTLYEQDYFTGATAGFGYSNYEADKKAMNLTFLKYLSLLTRFSKQPGTLLDVGAATGVFVELAKTKSWQAQGIDISSFAATQAQQRGIPVTQGVISSLQEGSQTFDAITLWDVFEHLQHPREDLATLHSKLSPEGLLAINTPDASSLVAKLLGPKWHLIIPPEHLILFTRTVLRDLLTQQGFTILYEQRVGKSFAPSYILSILYGWSKQRGFKYMENMVANSVINTIPLPIHLRDNILFISRKV